MTEVPDRPENGQLDSAEDIAGKLKPVNAPFATPEAVEAARELVRTLAVVQTNATLYPVTHPTVQQSVADLAHAVGRVTALGRDDVTINIYKGTLFVENQVFPEESVTFRRLIEDLLGRGVSAISFARSFSTVDGSAIADLLTDARVGDIETARAFLESKGATAVTLAETTTLEDTADEERGRRVRAAAREAYDTGLNAVREVEDQAKLGRVFEAGPLQGVVNTLLDNLLSDPAAVLGLTAIKGHDDYTLNHSINVCILSISLGSSLGLDADDLRSLGLASLLYDLGKVRIPEAILSKPGPLTAEEWAIVKRHAEEGADLLKRIQLVDRMPMIVAYEHHQRHDSMGYPSTPDEQHIFSKIVAVCDAYDAMTTDRPFRREIRPDKAIAVLMQGRGKAYDPEVTRALVAMLGIYPMGAVVTLSDGSTAVVYRVNNDDLLHPRVKVLADASGRWVEEPETVDLRLVDVDSGDFALTITECVPAADAGVDDVWQYL